MASSHFTRQIFHDSAKRRIAEAWLLLGCSETARLLAQHLVKPSAPSFPRRWSADGAVTCALLAAECALKATLLHGYQVDRIDHLPVNIQEELFEGSSGHKIPLLWLRQHSRVTLSAADRERDAVQRLSGVDRYRHRYGAHRPSSTIAEPHFLHAKTLVDWMSRVMLP